jgi:hypothetical protein
MDYEFFNALHFLSHEKAACFRADTELAKLTLAKPTLARMNRKKPAVLPQRVSSVTLGGVANLSTDQKLIWVRKEITRSLSVTPEPAAVYGDVSSMMTF